LKSNDPVTDFGGKLRQARERRGVPIRQIATKTKISPAALDALERNDVSKLPGGIFTRGFIRAYALEVGLDPAETVREFHERFGDGPVETDAAPAAAPFDDDVQRRRTAVIVKIIVAVFLAAALALYFNWRRTSSDAPPPVEPRAAAGKAASQQQLAPSPWTLDSARL
jgi:cytoskeleton protein RodZ